MTSEPITLVLAQAEGGKPTPPQHPLSNPLFMLVMIFIFIYFVLIRPEKRRADEKAQLLSALSKNDRVITTGGMYGTIVNLKDDEVTIRVDDQAKVKIRFLRSAIASVVSPTTTADTEEAKS